MAIPDTYYVDVSRYAEQPTVMLKSLFNYWFDRACWHRPSVLVLDNLDKLLSAEVEVCPRNCNAVRVLTVISTQIHSGRDFSQRCSAESSPPQLAHRR